ncbi:cryptochrome/photolyase family protein [Roseobacter sinensis]|uniref:Cryptochrome/photolyase family protein n=1 Tax=Roseobacter sinensis TaxID=2931391 RepID=A0ABT3BD13_9RHOB|nr:cryptochrome/photolyase family protein [Roseobacter sp. WL0113]MCV3271442.1 cryptochrome/photolyase family protein [Roseobacter sp. WL0113]
MSRLVLVLGDQLSPGLSALREADPDSDIVVMAEVAEETDYVKHHPKKIALIFAAMRKFAARLRDEGWDVRYSQLDDTQNAGSIVGELLRRAEETGAKEVLATEPGEWRLIDKLKHAPITTHILPDDRFIASHQEFEDWAEGRKALRMEYFYREMRRKTGLLMDGDEPVEGKWNFDHENRKPAPGEVAFNGPMQFTPDETVEEVLALVESRFGDHFGDLHPFWFATTEGEARRALSHFVSKALPKFGDYQDAMLAENRFLYHAVISAYINIGLLDPLEVCEQVAEAYAAGDVPINAAEGFVRQIIGWREYMRGIYFLKGPDYVTGNALGHERDLPALFWGGETKMRCLAKAVEQTRAEAYAHHIQRLMVTGNFALLAGIDPHQVHEWYLAVYMDAFEWVEAPNTIGMSQFADGGLIASKPYVSSGAYINRMSDYCKGCHYSVSTKTGEGACPFNLLYWHFLDRHRERFKDNARMGNMYRTWDRMDAERRATVIAEADAFLKRLDAGETV